MALPILGAVFTVPGLAREDGRRLKIRVEPVSGVAGSVQVLVTIAPDGHVKHVMPLGGDPALMNSAVAAIREWRYEVAAHESIATVELSFPG